MKFYVAFVYCKNLLELFSYDFKRLNFKLQNFESRGKTERNFS